MPKANLNEEMDKITRSVMSAYDRKVKMKAAVKEAMLDPEMKEAVRNYIFCGDPEAVNPLAEVRERWQK